MAVEFVLQWADDLDDWAGAAGLLAMSLGARLPALAGIAAAGLSGVTIGLGLGALWGLPG